MEPAEPYFRERARTERTLAADARSPETRKAHLELAVRYVKVAEALYVRTQSAGLDATSACEPTNQSRTERLDARRTLRSAFPLPASGAFSDLLKLID